MKKYLLLILILCISAPATLFSEEKKKDGVWYKVNEADDVNSIYVDYTSIKRKEQIVQFEQMEFLIEKQKLEGIDREYKFITTKRKADCRNKKYKIKEEKYFDIQVDNKKHEIKDEIIFENKYEDDEGDGWVTVIPNSLVEKVWRFVCLYKPE